MFPCQPLWGTHAEAGYHAEARGGPRRGDGMHWRCWVFGHQWERPINFIGRGIRICQRCGKIDVED